MRQYPAPPVGHQRRIREIVDALTDKGYHPFPAPCGVMLDEAQPQRSLCIRYSTCDGYPCLVHAKSDAHVIAVRPALEHENVTLLVNAEVVRLETGADGREVTGVVVDRAGSRDL